MTFDDFAYLFRAGFDAGLVIILYDLVAHEGVRGRWLPGARIKTRFDAWAWPILEHMKRVAAGLE